MEKNKVMLIVIIVLLVLLLGTIVGVTFYAVNVFNSPAEEEAVEQVEAIQQEDLRLITIADPIYTNLLVGEDNEEHVARISISIGVNGIEDDSETFIAMLTEKEVIIKDVVNGILRNKTYEELKKVEGKEILKDEILDKLRKEFDSNLIVTVYMHDIFLQ